MFCFTKRRSHSVGKITPTSALSLYCINRFMPNVFSLPYQLDESISNFRVVVWYFFLFLFKLKETPVSKNEEPDQTPRIAASDQVLHGLPMSHL